MKTTQDKTIKKLIFKLLFTSNAAFAHLNFKVLFFFHTLIL